MTKKLEVVASAPLCEIRDGALVFEALLVLELADLDRILGKIRERGINQILFPGEFGMLDAVQGARVLHANLREAAKQLGTILRYMDVGTATLDKSP